MRFPNPEARQFPCRCDRCGRTGELVFSGEGDAEAWESADTIAPRGWYYAGVYVPNVPGNPEPPDAEPDDYLTVCSLECLLQLDWRQNVDGSSRAVPQPFARTMMRVADVGAWLRRSVGYLRDVQRIAADFTVFLDEVETSAALTGERARGPGLAVRKSDGTIAYGDPVDKARATTGLLELFRMSIGSLRNVRRAAAEIDAFLQEVQHHYGTSDDDFGPSGSAVREALLALEPEEKKESET